MRWVIGGFIIMALLVVGTLGWRGMRKSQPPLIFYSDMKYQPKYNAQGASQFFADGRSMRIPPKGTLAYAGADYVSDAGSPLRNPDFLQEDDDYYRGKSGQDWVEKLPVKIDQALLRRGGSRFDAFCSSCHGIAGYGNGIATEYGLVGVPNFHDKRLREMAAGQIYHTITNGKGVMLPYGDRIQVSDRWAIVAYVRALQRSQNATLDDVPEPYRTELTNE